jgi:hypothetical protein
MSETKTTYIMPDQNGFGGNDLATFALLGGGAGGFGGNGMWNNPFMYLVWLYMMRWMNGGDWGQGGQGDCYKALEASTQRQIQTLADQMQDNHTSDILMAAIHGNNSAIQEAATRLGCDINTVASAIQGVRSDIATVGSQLGFSSERIINAVNQGDCGVIQALKDCCCETQKSILTNNYENRIAISDATASLKDTVNFVGLQVEKGFSNSNYETQAQTCALQGTIRDTGTANTNAIIAKLDAMQNQALLDKIDALREKNSEQAVVINNAQQSAAFNQMLNSYTAPIANAVNSLQTELASVKCRLPETVTLPYSCATAVPSSLFYNGAVGINTFNSGWGAYSGCGCNNTLWG